MWTSLLGGTIHRATELRLCTGVLSQELGGSCRTPRGTALVGEAWLVVGGQSGAGGLGGTEPWPGCLGAREPRGVLPRCGL